VPTGAVSDSWARFSGDIQWSNVMARKVVLDPFHWHEALDRALIVAEMYYELLHDHPAVRQTPVLRKKAESISDALFDFYQSVGRADPDTVTAAKSLRRRLKKS
jgi:hypothetical protein